MARADGDVVEEAEAHRGRLAGMMARRSNRTERIAEFAGDHAIGRLDHRTRRTQRRVPGVGIHRGIRIDGPIALLWYAGFQSVDVGRVMGARQRFFRRDRCVEVLQVRRNAGGNQMVVYGRQPFRAFGMPGTHFVRGAGTVREEPCVKHVSF